MKKNFVIVKEKNFHCHKKFPLSKICCLKKNFFCPSQKRSLSWSKIFFCHSQNKFFYNCEKQIFCHYSKIFLKNILVVVKKGFVTRPFISNPDSAIHFRPQFGHALPTPLASPHTPQSGPHTPLVALQTPLASPQTPLAALQTPLASPKTPLVGPQTPQAGISR